MSQIMEKTLASIPKLLTQSLIGGGGGGGSKTQQRQMPAMDVQNFMKVVHRARSKSHESHIVNAELSNIELKLKQADVSSSTVVRNCFTKILYCHILGYNVNFVTIHVLKLAHQGHGFEKRLGYLMSCLLLSPHSEMTLLLMGTLLRDIKSSNMNDNCIALKVAGELVDEECIPSFLPDVIQKFSHQHDLVKEKAIHCFGNFYRRSPELLQSDIGRLNVFLTSRDPGVLMAVMNVFVILTTENPSQFKGLGTSFLHILDQINNRGFGSSYYYHMIPLPWLQICLLKVLGNLGHVDPHLSTSICPLLKTLIEKTKVSVPISLAVLVESILTATKIHPNEALLHLCSRCIMKLLASDSSEDMRYQGLGLLIALSRIKPSFASQHQVAVIECLTNEDHAIQSRTTLLLHAMANRANVKAICSKLFEQLDKNKELNSQQEILMMISDLTERFSPDVDWYISINFNILSHNLSQVTQDKVTDLVLKKIRDISGPDQMIDGSSVRNLTETLFLVLEKQNYLVAEFSLAIQLFGILAPILQDDFSSERFLELVSKCLLSSVDYDSVMSNLCTVYSPDHFSEKNKIYGFSNKDMLKLKCQCVVTVTKMVLCQCIQTSSILQWLDSINYKSSLKNSFLRTDLDELYELARNPQDLKTKSTIFLQDSSHIDYSLSFLDSLVIKDMLKGGECYKPYYIKMPDLSQPQSHSSSNVSDDKEIGSLISEKLTPSLSSEFQASRKMPNKWSDNDNDDYVVDDEWTAAGGNERFVLINSDDKYLEELNQKKKAAEELFAGLNESMDEDMRISMSQSILSETVSSPPQPKRGKSIWDDDDDDGGDVMEDFDHKKHSIFSMGNTGINPFGISKKSKAKSSQWTKDLDGNSNVGLSGNVNNNNDKYDFMHTPSMQPQNSYMYCTESGLSDLPWSDVKESLSVVHESIPSVYSSPSTDSGPHSLVATPDRMSGSTVDALTDSDPEGNNES